MAAGPRFVTYSARELDELELAWATTVHKAQGGEVPIVVVALSTQYGPILSRRLLYTGKLPQRMAFFPLTQLMSK